MALDSSGYVGYYNSIAVDSNGLAHICYFDEDNYALNYIAQTSSSTWGGIQTLDSGSYFTYPSIAVGANGLAQVSYYDEENGVLNYVLQDLASPSGWSIPQVVDSGQDLSNNGWSDVGAYSSIAVDSNNHAHISYYDGGNDCLKVASWGGTSWEIQYVNHPGNGGAYSHLALDANGFEHISYAGQSSSQHLYNSRYGYYYYNDYNYLMYACWDGSRWVTQTVDDSAYVLSSCIALNANGYPCISYFDDNSGALKVASVSQSYIEVKSDSQGSLLVIGRRPRQCRL